MSTILSKIMAHRKRAVAQMKEVIPMEAWEMFPGYEKASMSLKAVLEMDRSTGIIAEFKRASPSKGIINNTADVVDVTSGYEHYGASALSVLTEPEFFRGSSDDMLNAGISASIPMLRKDFIFDRYQVAESKALGADVILLIAACLTPHEVKDLATFAKQVGMEVILEIHDEAELGHICNETEMVGVNNRNLNTFEVDINRSLAMSKKIPAGKIMIAESGIDNVETISIFKEAGFRGFLMGEYFMKEKDPAEAFNQFVQKLKQG